MTAKIQDALLGLAVGDALGVPVEFKSRETLRAAPVTGMIGYGSHGQAPGTWSDDSSLAFCLAESLCRGYNLKDLANRFVNWYRQGYWGAHYEVFDIGNATAQAIRHLEQGVEPTQAGGTNDWSNGNGSLMRILPLAFYIKGQALEKRYQTTVAVSALTHGHIRSMACCFLYVEWAIELINGADKFTAFNKAQQTVRAFLDQAALLDAKEQIVLQRLLNESAEDWAQLDEKSIQSSGYVVHTLEASVWCILSANNYAETVLKAVNLGEDTDTTGAVAGGLAGLVYGAAQIPTPWLDELARKEDIIDLSVRFADALKHVENNK